MPEAETCYDVAIAGFGPTGATLAGLLGRLGRSVLVIEREPEVYRLPRAVHFDHEVMRTFQALGVAEAVLAHTRIVPRYEFWNARRQVLISAPFDRGETDQGWSSDYMFHQPSLERILRDSAAKRGGVCVRYGALTQVREQDEEVELSIEGPDGRREAARARYLVGCDGAGSMVRSCAGLGLEDLEFDEPWVVVDLLGARGLPENAIQLCDPARPTTIIPCAGGYHRFEFMLRPGETPEQMQRPDSLRGLLSAWLDPDSVELVRAAVYRFHAVVAREWWRGRLGVAGDAAHQTPPFLGQGMCAGIRDAVNLAWKLDLVVRGLAAPDLLETYGSERSPHVREFIERAITAGRIVCTQDPEVARARDARMLAQRESGGDTSLPASLPDLGPGLFQAGDHPKIGRLAPQPRLRGASGEQRCDDVFGSGFRLILRDPRGWPDATRQGVLETLGGTALVWSDAPGSAPEGSAYGEDSRAEAGAFFTRHDLHALLIRPDHAIFGVARAPEDVGPLVDQLGAALRAPTRSRTQRA